LQLQSRQNAVSKWKVDSNKIADIIDIVSITCFLNGCLVYNSSMFPRSYLSECERHGGQHIISTCVNKIKLAQYIT